MSAPTVNPHRATDIFAPAKTAPTLSGPSYQGEGEREGASQFPSVFGDGLSSIILHIAFVYRTIKMSGPAWRLAF
ncbi:hypothetical protein E2C01_047243 [Portunus trituberculatus]|uniref:Uncharacterized protein n=1 Tax=Portunus trituberculatus TaxID=210409 RepID=A0A5B7G9Y2_PORTR|nr:hypothetical protein [Portunus trituberculatus]